MGRPRKTKRNIPPYVYFHRGRWFHKQYLGSGKFGPEKKLADRDATDKEIWDAYLERIGTGTAFDTLRWLCEAYMQSPYFARRAPTTQREYERYSVRICNTLLQDGRVFGDVSPSTITPGVIRRYMDKRAENAPVMANRELEFLSVVFGFGYERDYVKRNSAKGVKKQPEAPRTRYVTDSEYAAVYKRSPVVIQLAMEFAYLCRLRRGEIIGPDSKDASKLTKYEGLQRKHILEEGLHVVRAKGSKEQIIVWTPRLIQAVERAKALPGDVGSLYLLHNQHGQKIRKAAFSSAWQRAMAKAEKEAGIRPFAFHDLKAKGVSDFGGDKAKASGHKSLRMVAVYDRRIESIESTK